jgi:uncharacterized delta-60 repeat protein
MIMRVHATTIRNILGATVLGGALAAAGPAAALAATASKPPTPSPSSLDTTFGKAGRASLSSDTRFFAVASGPKGEVVAAGQRGIQNNATLVVARVTSTGKPDGSFGTGGVATGPAVTSLNTLVGSIGRAVAVQPDGKIVVAGTATDPSAIGTFGMLVERFNSNGTLDTSFGSGGVVRIFQAQSGQGLALALQPDGKIIVGGTADAPDSGDPTGSAYPLVAIARLNSDGSLDPGFGSGGSEILQLGRDAQVNALALTPSGQVVLAGSQREDLQTTSTLLARLNADGSLDAGFASGGVVVHQYAVSAGYSSFQAVSLDSSGRIVAAGTVAKGNDTDALIARFTSAGAPDGSFGTGGIVTPSAETNFLLGGPGTVPGASGVYVAPNGDVIASGTYADSGLDELALWALKANGAADTTFGKGGAVQTLGPTGTSLEGNALTESQGRLVLAGSSFGSFGDYTGSIARYNGFGLDAAAPGVRVGSSQISFNRAGRGKLTVLNSNSFSVKVSLTLHSRNKLRVGRSRKIVRFATASRSVRAGTRVTFTLRLSRANASLLSHQRKVAGTAQLTITDAFGNRAQVKEAVRLAG